MPRPVTAEQLRIIMMVELGYIILSDEDERLLFLLPEAPGRPVGFDFSRGPIEWADLQETLEYEGINPDVVASHLEAMG